MTTVPGQIAEAAGPQSQASPSVRAVLDPPKYVDISLEIRGVRPVQRPRMWSGGYGPAILRLGICEYPLSLIEIKRNEEEAESRYEDNVHVLLKSIKPEAVCIIVAYCYCRKLEGGLAGLGVSWLWSRRARPLTVPRCARLSSNQYESNGQQKE